MTGSENFYWISLAFYFTIMLIGVVYPGIVLFRTGKAYLDFHLTRNPDWVNPINKTLLTGYYLITGGYTIWNVSAWPNVYFMQQMLEVVSRSTGQIILFMGIFHFCNLLIINLLGNKFNSINT